MYLHVRLSDVVIVDGASSLVAGRFSGRLQRGGALGLVAEPAGGDTARRRTAGNC